MFYTLTTALWLVLVPPADTASDHKWTREEIIQKWVDGGEAGTQIDCEVFRRRERDITALNGDAKTSSRFDIGFCVEKSILEALRNR